MTDAGTGHIEADDRLMDASRIAGVPDAFQRLWTPHRMAYIQAGPEPLREDRRRREAAEERGDDAGHEAQERAERGHEAVEETADDAVEFGCSFKVHRVACPRDAHEAAVGHGH